MKKLVIKSSLQILASAESVYEAIADPDKMSNYFISESTGRIQQGKDLIWKFPEFKESFPVTVLEAKKPESISFEWEGAEKHQTRVKITLEEIEDLKTVVHITESEMPATDEGITWYGRNTGGWANFLASLKAYVEYNINLRKGAYDFMGNKS